MDITRAQRIVSAISTAAFAAMGLNDDAFPNLSDLIDVSLAEMLEAARAIEAENDAVQAHASINGGGYTITAVPVERLIAAVFVLVNYEHSRQPIAVGNRRVVAVLPESAVK